MSRWAQGYATISHPDGQVKEIDTFTCCHCNEVVFVRERCDPIELGGFCTLCMKHTCPKCSTQSCTPFEKRLEEMERRDRLLRSCGV